MPGNAHNTSLRVLITADGVGGVWSYCLELVRVLASAGCQIAIAVMGPALSADQRRELAPLAGVELFEGRYALEWTDEPWAEVDAAGQWLLELERRIVPDVVHLNGFCHGALRFQAPALVVAHSCVCSWWEAVFGEPAPERYAEYRRRVTAGLERAARVVAPSRAMLAALGRHYRALSRARVIYNGLDPDGCLPPARKQPFYLAAGRLWDPAKNLDTLLAAARRCPWPLKVAGELPEPNPKYTPNVELLGPTPRSRLRQLMEEAAVFVHPARYEPFGLAPLEAALAGCALLLSDVDSLREIWGDSAVYAPGADPGALAAAASELALDVGRRERLARAARRRAVGYDAASMGHAYLDLYHELCRERPARRDTPNHPARITTEPCES